MSTAETRREHIEAWQSSGMTQRAYCQVHGLNVKTFGSWVRAYRGVQHNRSASMIPVTIKPMSLPVDVLRLRGRGDHVLELPPTVAPHWLGELLKCLG
jgi:hypothetical protein